MTPTLQAQLDRLQATLAARRTQQPALLLKETRVEKVVRPPVEAVARSWASLESRDPPLRRPDPLEALPAALPTPAEASRQLVALLVGELAPTAYRLYWVLHHVALVVAGARGYHPKTTHVTFHCPLEIVALVLGVHRSTIWRHLPTLLARGLIDTRPHKATLRGQTRNDGSLWQVRLHPKRGTRARLSYDELKHTWRDLEGDVEQGRTAYEVVKQGVQQSKDLPLEQVDTAPILAWALPPQGVKTPLGLTVAAAESGTGGFIGAQAAGPARGELERLLDLPFMPRAARAEAVDGAAKTIAGALGDTGSLNFYRLLLWNLLRARDHLGLDGFGVLYNAVDRVRVDLLEGFARRPGALLVSRLKRWQGWEALQRVAHLRVGEEPLVS